MKLKNIIGGTTALVVLFMDDGAAYVAHVGDSRAVMCKGKNAIRLTTDHKPGNPFERQRITDNGGTITTEVLADGL